MSNSDDKMTEDYLLPDIEDYLEANDYNFPINVGEELEELLNYLISKSDLNREQGKIFIKYFFQEIRVLLLQGHQVCLRNFGYFQIKSGERVRIKFRPSKKITKRLK